MMEYIIQLESYDDTIYYDADDDDDDDDDVDVDVDVFNNVSLPGRHSARMPTLSWWEMLMDQNQWNPPVNSIT